MGTALPAKGVERLSFTKGVSTSFLRLTAAEDPTTRVAIVLNTHLQSDYWSSGRDTRAKQISCIKDVVHRAEMECAGNGYEVDRIMLVGDLNIVAGSGEYEDLMASFPGAVDLMAPLTDIDGSIAGREGSTRGVDRSFRLTFPVARWRHVVLPCLGESRYIDLVPKVSSTTSSTSHRWSRAACRCTTDTQTLATYTMRCVETLGGWLSAITTQSWPCRGNSPITKRRGHNGRRRSRLDDDRTTTTTDTGELLLL